MTRAAHRPPTIFLHRRWRGPLLAAVLGGASLAGQAQSVVTYATANGAVYSHDSNGGVVYNNGGGLGAALGGSTDIGVTTSTSVVSGACQSNPPGCASTATTASLVDASLHATVTTSGSGVGTTRARWTDALTFHVAGATSETRTDIVLDFHLTGAVVPSGEGLVNWTYSFSGPGTFTRSFEDNFSTGVVFNDWLNAGGTPGFKRYEVLSATATDFHLRGVVELPAPTGPTASCLSWGWRASAAPAATMATAPASCWNCQLTSASPARPACS